jgi:hypothetical protein
LNGYGRFNFEAFPVKMPGKDLFANPCREMPAGGGASRKPRFPAKRSSHFKRSEAKF